MKSFLFFSEMMRRKNVERIQAGLSPEEILDSPPDSAEDDPRMRVNVAGSYSIPVPQPSSRLPWGEPKRSGAIRHRYRVNFEETRGGSADIPGATMQRERSSSAPNINAIHQDDERLKEQVQQILTRHQKERGGKIKATTIKKKKDSNYI